MDSKQLTSDVINVVDGELKRHNFLHRKSADTRYGMQGCTRQNVKLNLEILLEGKCKPFLKPSNLAMKQLDQLQKEQKVVESASASSRSDSELKTVQTQLEKANYRIKHLLRTICELENREDSKNCEKPKKFLSVVNEMSCDIAPLQPLPNNKLVRRTQYLDGTVDYYLHTNVKLKDGSMSTQPFRIIHPHEWEQFEIKDDVRLACPRGVGNSRCRECAILFRSYNIIYPYTTFPLVDEWGWPGFYWIDELIDPDTNKFTDAEMQGFKRAQEWKRLVMYEKQIQTNDQFELFVEDLKQKSSLGKCVAGKNYKTQPIKIRETRNAKTCTAPAVKTRIDCDKQLKQRKLDKQQSDMQLFYAKELSRTPKKLQSDHPNIKDVLKNSLMRHPKKAYEL